jgi:hypothetical protein
VPPTDDTADLQAALDKGGTIQLEGRVYHTTQALKATVSKTRLVGTTGTVLDFSPQGTERQWCLNDRAIAIQCQAVYTGQLPIAHDIALGATSFTALNLADVANLNPGDWVIITLSDTGVPDAGTHLGYPTSVDWVQVESVVGTTVNTVKPFRLAFTNSLPFSVNNSGLGFMKAMPLADVSIEHLAITVEASAIPAVGVYVWGSRNTTLDDVTITSDWDQVYTELSQGLSILNSHIIGTTVLNELAESVDITISGCTFNNPASVPIALDLGTGFFTVDGNTIEASGHVAIYAFYHVHDGAITNNTIKPITDLKNAGTVGIMLYGSPDITITGNTITGGAHAVVGIQVSNNPNSVLPELDTGDVVSGNTITGFETPVYKQ